MRRIYLLCGLCGLCGLLAVLGETGRRPPDARPAADTLVIATTYEPTSLHPVFGIDRMAAVEIMGAIFEPLTLYDDQRRLLPCLATEVPSLANGGLRLLGDAEARARGGRMESVWNLRPDARWSDGVPVTADDFVFTYQLIRDPAVPAVSREVEDRIVSMESRDGGRTLVVLWREPYAFADEGHRHLVVPRHIEGPWLEGLADRREYERTPFNRQPVGNGPYRVAEWAIGRHLVLEPQPFWHGPRPTLGRIVYRFIPEGETILANLDTGRLGAVSPVALEPELASEYEHRARSRRDDTYVVDRRPGMWWIHVDFNTEKPVTADRRVRQALAAGLDRAALCATLFPGQDCLADTWLPPTHPAAQPPRLPRYPYDPDRAGRLLDAAGWVRDADGLRRKGGRSLRLPLKFPTGEPLLDRVAQMIQEDWRRLGVDLNLRPEEPRKFGEASAANRAYEGLSLGLWVMDPSADGVTFWTTANIPTDANPTGQNNCRWRNTRSDELLLRATETLDPAERHRLMCEHLVIWAEELPAIPLFFQQEVSVHHRDLEDWRPTGSETPVTWNCPAWRWKR